MPNQPTELPNIICLLYTHVFSFAFRGLEGEYVVVGRGDFQVFCCLCICWFRK